MEFPPNVVVFGLWKTEAKFSTFYPITLKSHENYTIKKATSMMQLFSEVK